MNTYDITVAEGATIHICESKSHEFLPRLSHNRATHEGMLPAPNAWTPLPGKKTTKVVNMIKKTDFEKVILKEVQSSLQVVRGMIRFDNVIPAQLWAIHDHCHCSVGNMHTAEGSKISRIVGCATFS